MQDTAAPTALEMPGEQPKLPRTAGARWGKQQLGQDLVSHTSSADDEEHKETSPRLPAAPAPAPLMQISESTVWEVLLANLTLSVATHPFLCTGQAQDDS